jgi:Domain of unknown function (DUF3472)/Domain of unknown function (DUF5077)
MIKLFLISLLFLVVTTNVVSQSKKMTDTYSIPVGFNSWVLQNPDETRLIIKQEGISNWNKSEDKIRTYFWLEKTGALTIRIVTKLNSGSSKIKFTLGNEAKMVNISNAKFDTLTVGKFNVEKAGYQFLEMQGIKKNDDRFADLSTVIISGEATSGSVHFAKDDFIFERRGPHADFGYNTPKEASDIVYFYNEVTVPKGEDPVGTYYCANGFNVGYFGIQVNSLTECRILFSVWSPFKTDYPDEIPQEDRVKWLKKGNDVNVGTFGNEGAGSKSIRKYNWITGSSYKFLLKAEPQENNSTTFTAWFFAPEIGRWELMASFNRPKTNSYLKGLYSFLENFKPNMGDVTRKVQYDNQWVCDKNGKWFEITDARYNPNGTARKLARLDHGGGVEDGHFFLKSCGFFNEKVDEKQIFSRKPTGRIPNIDFNKLP